MVVLYILLGIIAAVVLLFCVKITVEFRYEEAASAEVRVLFVRIPLMPREEKPKKPKKEKPKKEPEKEEEPKEEKPKEEKKQGESFVQRFFREQGFSGVMLFLRDILAALNTMLGDIFKRSFVVEKLFLHITVSKSDAAETAIAYGKTCAAVYPALGCMCTHLRVRQYDAVVAPDYLANGSTGQMVFAISVRPIKLTNALVRFAFRALIAFLKAKKRASKTKSKPGKKEQVQTVSQ